MPIIIISEAAFSPFLSSFSSSGMFLANSGWKKLLHYPSIWNPHDEQEINGKKYWWTNTRLTCKTYKSINNKTHLWRYEQKKHIKFIDSSLQFFIMYHKTLSFPVDIAKLIRESANQILANSAKFIYHIPHKMLIVDS